ncbi:MAG: N-acetylmuramoyl-L-alanine amidase family protein, partial [Enterococcus sp.]
MSFIKYEYININEYSRPGIRNNGIDGIVMHYTANNGGTARNHKNYFNNLKGNYASAQLFIDDIEALCIIPLNEVAYHANEISKYNADGSRYRPLYSKIGNANYSTIGVEMCLDKNGNITEKTFQNTVKAVKELIAIYPNITRDKIWRHFDVTGKNCPAPWVEKPSELERFKEAVFGKTGGNNTVAKEEYYTTPGWYTFLKDDTLYTSTSFGKDKVSGIKVGKGTRFYADEVVTNPSGTAYRGVILKFGKSGKRYFTLNKKYVKKA